MKNDSKLTRLVAYVLLITIVALILVSGTYAKYVTEISASDTAVVAKFKVGSSVSDASFDLFKTAKEIDGVTADTDVVNGKIAPGTGGKFAITLTNDSDVAVNYTLSIKEEGNTSSVPIEYSIDGTNYVTAAQFSSAANSTGKLDIGSTTQTTKEVVVYWRWAFEGTGSTNFKTTQTDVTDTGLGTAATPATFNVTVSSTFTQVD